MTIVLADMSVMAVVPHIKDPYEKYIDVLYHTLM
jgi:hypothetical protein